MRGEHKYFTYIVCSRSGTLYIGMTNDIERRMRDTRLGRLKGLPASTTATGWFTSKVLMTCATRLTVKSS
jgi:predicted GIY-YIG superfamily endonuclease